MKGLLIVFLMINSITGFALDGDKTHFNTLSEMYRNSMEIDEEVLASRKRLSGRCFDSSSPNHPINSGYVVDAVIVNESSDVGPIGGGSKKTYRFKSRILVEAGKKPSWYDDLDPKKFELGTTELITTQIANGTASYVQKYEVSDLKEKVQIKVYGDYLIARFGLNNSQRAPDLYCYFFKPGL